MDACLERHGITEFTTYQWGTKVIDYILVDADVARCIQSIGYEPFGIHILSDHQGLFIDLRTAQCFGLSITPLQLIQLRDLSTRRSHQIAPYFQVKHKHLEDHNWFHMIKKLHRHMQQDSPNYTLAEALYECLIAASIHSGLQLKKFPPAPFLPTIVKLRNMHRLLKLAVTQYKTSRDMTDNIARTKAKLGTIDYNLPDNAEPCQRELVKVTQQLKAAIQDKIDTKRLAASRNVNPSP